MKTEKKYEILNALPAYGAMYIPIASDGDSLYSEGFVVRFFKSDNTNWVANFQLGWTGFSKIYDFPLHDIVIVIAGGQSYVMSPDSEIPKIIFGLTINETVQTDNGSLAFADDTHILYFDNSNGEFWHSERISLDGIKDLKIINNVLYGKSFDPLYSDQDWSDFSIDLITKNITGGSWKRLLQNNSHLDQTQNKILSKKIKKAWWKIWQY